MGVKRSSKFGTNTSPEMGRHLPKTAFELRHKRLSQFHWFGSSVPFMSLAGMSIVLWTRLFNRSVFLSTHLWNIESLIVIYIPWRSQCESVFGSILIIVRPKIVDAIIISEKLKSSQCYLLCIPGSTHAFTQHHSTISPTENCRWAWGSRRYSK